MRMIVLLEYLGSDGLNNVQLVIDIQVLVFVTLELTWPRNLQLAWAP